MTTFATTREIPPMILHAASWELAKVDVDRLLEREGQSVNVFVAGILVGTYRKRGGRIEMEQYPFKEA